MSDTALPSIIDKTKPGIEWDDVIGLEAVKATLEDAVITPLNAPQTDGEGTDRCYYSPGPATQLAKGYASLFQKMLRKGLFSSFLYVLDIGKKGPF